MLTQLIATSAASTALPRTRTNLIPISCSSLSCTARSSSRVPVSPLAAALESTANAGGRGARVERGGGAVDRLKELDHRFPVARVAQRIRPRAGTAVGLVLEHVVERQSRTAVQIRRAVEDRDERGHVEPVHAARL